MRIRPLFSMAALGLIGAGVTGCVPEEKYQALRIERDGLRDSLDNAQSQLSGVNGEKAALKRQLDALAANGDSTSALYTNLQQRIAQLESENTDLRKRYDDAVGRIATGPSLPAALTTELTAFADANPQLVSFDASTGMMRFKSDVTFASGDAQIQPAAQAVIARFSEILKSPEASKYEILIAGHADNQPVSAATVTRGHKDNWYISAHRALSVAEALRKGGVDGRRIGAAGFGEMRPVADNSSPAGKAMNRRVEVIILPKPITSGTAVASTPPAPAPQANVPAEQPTRRMDPGLSK